MAKGISYKAKYEAEKTRWETLKLALEKAQAISEELPSDRITYDKATIGQVLFMMSTLED